MKNQNPPSIPNGQYFVELRPHLLALDALAKKGVDLFRELDKSEASRAKFVLQAALHRNLKLRNGLKLMLETRNLLCAASIVRMQIDTCMRLNAPLVVPKNRSEDCFRAILMPNQSLRKITIEVDDKKKKLDDKFLKDELGKRMRGTAKKYDLLSGYIHLDESAFWDSYSARDDSEWHFTIGGEAAEEMDLLLLRMAEWFGEYTLGQHKIMADYEGVLADSSLALKRDSEAAKGDAISVVGPFGRGGE